MNEWIRITSLNDKTLVCEQFAQVSMRVKSETFWPQVLYPTHYANQYKNLDPATAKGFFSETLQVQKKNWCNKSQDSSK